MPTDRFDLNGPQIVLARVKIQNMEKSHIWQAGAMNLPEGMRLCLALR